MTKRFNRFIFSAGLPVLGVTALVDVKLIEMTDPIKAGGVYRSPRQSTNSARFNWKPFIFHNSFTIEMFIPVLLRTCLLTDCHSVFVCSNLDCCVCLCCNVRVKI